jgi:hypothetical protein
MRVMIENLGKEQRDLLATFRKYKNKALTSFCLYQFAMYLLLNEPDKDAAIRTLREETNNLKRLRTPDKNYYYIHEAYPLDVSQKIKESKLFPARPVVHNLLDIQGKWNDYVEEVLAKISAKSDVKADFSGLIANMWTQYKKNKKKLKGKMDELIDQLIVNRYIWWDVVDLDTIQKLAFCSFIEINGVIHLVGAGFTEKKIQKKINLFNNVFGVSFILLVLFSILFFNRTHITQKRYFVFYILLAIISTTLIALSNKPAGSAEKELYEKRILNNVAIGIAGTSVTIMLASSFLYFKQPLIQQAFQNNLLFSLLIISLSAILQPNKTDLTSIMRTKQLQLVSLNVSFYFILIALIIYLNNL